MLGVLKAGLPYLPLDRTYPAERLAYMLADSAAAALLATGATLAEVRSLAPPAARVLNLDDGYDRSGGRWRERRGSAPARPIAPADVAYLT